MYYFSAVVINKILVLINNEGATIPSHTILGQSTYLGILVHAMVNYKNNFTAFFIAGGVYS